MSLAALIVRPLASTEEYTAYYRLTNTAFSSEPSEEGAQRSLQTALQSPDFQAERVRGAFRDEQLLGGYTIYERILRMGNARLSIGAIGAVVTAPNARKQGVARALMQDALDFAQKNNHTLLLLDGIPNFYFRFGYIDMFDLTIVEINRSAILAQPPVGLGVRLATIDDAPAVLDLYQRHFGAYTGSFERSLEIQRYRIQRGRRPLLIAHSPQGQIEGYLQHDIENELSEGHEVATDSWDALLALLRYHAELFDAGAASNSLQYFLAPESPMTHWIIDKLEVPDTSQWHAPAQEWGARSITHHHRFTGWMASLINYPLLMDSLLPELQARWQRSLARWGGEINLVVEGQNRVLHLNETEVQWAEHTGGLLSQVELSAQAFVQLVFGYRPLSQLVDTSYLATDARYALAILFPTGHTWIPRTDWF